MTISIGASLVGRNVYTTDAIATQVAGSSFAVLVCGQDTPPTSITDSKGNTYSALGSVWSSSMYGFNFVARAFLCLNGVGGSGHTFTQVGANYPTVCVAEVISTSALSIESDDWVTAAAQGALPRSLGSVSASAGSIALGFFGGSSASLDVTYSYTNSFVGIAEQGLVSYWGGGIAYRIPGSGGGQSTTLSSTDASLMHGGMLALKEASGGGGGIPAFYLTA